MILGLYLVSSGLSLADEGEVALTFVLRESDWGEIGSKLGELFEERHPNVDVEWRGVLDFQKITVEMVAGTAPDVFEMWPPTARDWAEKRLLLNLSPYVERDFSEEVISDFVPIQWKASALDGYCYGIPRYINASIIYYNEDLLSRAGLLTPHELEQRGEWTWDALVRMAQRTTQRDPEGHVKVYGFERKHPWECWVWSNGGKVVNWPDNPAEVLLDRPEAIQALNWLCSLIWDYEVVASASEMWNYDFRQGNVALADTWGIAVIKLNEMTIGDKFKWNMAPLPLSPKGTRTSYTFVDMWGIPASTKHPDQAWELLKFLVSPEVQALFVQDTVSMPTRISVMPYYADIRPELNMQYAIDSALNSRPVLGAIVPAWQQVGPILDSLHYNAILTENQPVETAVKDAVTRIRAIYQELKASTD